MTAAASSTNSSSWRLLTLFLETLKLTVRGWLTDYFGSPGPADTHFKYVDYLRHLMLNIGSESLERWVEKGGADGARRDGHTHKYRPEHAHTYGHYTHAIGKRGMDLL